MSKRLRSIVGKFLIVVTLTVMVMPTTVFASPEFGEYGEHSGSVVDFIGGFSSSLFSILGIEVTEERIKNIDPVHGFSTYIYNKLEEQHEGISEIIYNNVEWNGALSRFVLNFTDAQLDIVIGAYSKLLKLLYGNDALNGDPLESLVQFDRCIRINNEYLIPFVATKNANLTDLTGATITPESFAQKGQYTNLGMTYEEFRTVIKNAPNGRYALPFTIYMDNGTGQPQAVNKTSTHYFTNIDFDVTAGKGFRIMYAQNVYDYNYYCRVPDGNNTYNNIILGAFMPVYHPNKTTERFALLQYSYIYDGTVPSAWDNKRYHYTWIASQASSNYTPYFYDSGFVKMGGKGVTEDDIGTAIYKPEWQVPGDVATPQEVTRRYIDRDLPVENPFADPNSWNTGLNGTYGDGKINIPNFQLPDLNIDWSLDGITKKFPFSIPWDIIAILSLFDVEPEIPRIQGTVDLGLTEWEIDWSLEQFEPLAKIFRTFFLISFILGLIVATRSFTRG